MKRRKRRAPARLQSRVVSSCLFHSRQSQTCCHPPRSLVEAIRFNADWSRGPGMGCRAGRGASGCGSVVECGLPKPEMRVRFPSPAPVQWLQRSAPKRDHRQNLNGEIGAVFMKIMIRFTRNGKPRTIATNPERPRLEGLRGVVQMTGTKFGCSMIQSFNSPTNANSHAPIL